MQLSVTKIDTYDRYMRGVLSFDELRKRLRGETPVTPQMERGTNLHHFIYKSLGFNFEAETPPFPDDILKIVKEKFRGEWAVEQTYERRFLFYNILGICDLVNDTEVVDIKYTEKQPQFDWYYSSNQWRYYLWLTGRQRFRYSVFWINNKGVDYSEFRFYAYGGLDSYCDNLAKEFFGFLSRYYDKIFA